MRKPSRDCWRLADVRERVRKRGNGKRRPLALHRNCVCVTDGDQRVVKKVSVHRRGMKPTEGVGADVVVW